MREAVIFEPTYSPIGVIAVSAPRLNSPMPTIRSTAPTAKDVFKILTDGFFIPGVLFLGVGGISYVTREGAFDGIGYAFSSIFVTKNWSSRRFKDRETYAQYKERKAGKRTVLAFLLHVGGIMFILSMVCLLIYNLV